MGLFSYIKHTFSVSREEVDPVNPNAEIYNELLELGIPQGRLHRRNGESASQQAERLQSIKDKQVVTEYIKDHIEPTSYTNDTLSMSEGVLYSQPPPPLGFNFGKHLDESEQESMARRQEKMMELLRIKSNASIGSLAPSVSSHSPTAAYKQMAHQARIENQLGHEARLNKLLNDANKRNSDARLQYYSVEEYVEMLVEPSIVRTVQVLFSDLPNEISLRVEYMDNLHAVDGSIVKECESQLARIREYGRITNCKRIVVTYVQKEVVE
jgi:hypothetical protein